MAASPQFHDIFLLSILLATYSSALLGYASSHHSLGHEIVGDGGEGSGGSVPDAIEDCIRRRILMSFQEKFGGENITYECSPSGPCVSCSHSEKNDEKYRCSETGYRIPFKCTEIEVNSKETNGKRTKRSLSSLDNTLIRHRHLLDSSMSGIGSQAYITYRSCIPSINEEKLSVLGFEGMMIGLLLISGSVIFIRRKRASAMTAAGALRVPNNSRF